MYEQIASNKRRSVVYVLLFFLIWLGVGAPVGLVAAQFAQPGRPSPRAGDVLTGIVVAGLLALIGIAFSLRSGARLVLAVSGAHPADPSQYAQLHHIVEALAIGDGIPKPAV